MSPQKNSKRRVKDVGPWHEKRSTSEEGVKEDNK